MRKLLNNRLLQWAVVGMLFGGCALGRGSLRPTVNIPFNPPSGPVVKIRTVLDKRVFVVDPKKPSDPSLMNVEDYSNKDIKERAIARKRSGLGFAIGDILLPDQTVSDLVKDIMTRALRLSGYIVADEGDPNFDMAKPLDMEINKLWGWFSPGFWTVSIEFIGEINVRGNVSGFENGKVINGYARRKSMSASTRDWDACLNLLINDIVTNIKK